MTMVFRFGISISHEWTPAFVELYRTLRLPQHIYHLLRYAIFIAIEVPFLKSRLLKVPAHFAFFETKLRMQGPIWIDIQIGAARS